LALSDADRALIDAAREVQKHSHAPISRYYVGSAVRTTSGDVYVGCNVENIVLPETICAEKNALYSAVAAGERNFDAVAVYTNSVPPASPCGSCRQVLYAWGVRRILLANDDGDLLEMNIEDLLPHAFRLKEPEAGD
jgi:cytidine deaminase